LETARCYEEGVLTEAADADVGALLAWGFPSWTGGPLALIDTVGTQRFVEECEQFSTSWGVRFTPSFWLRERARKGTHFYSRVAHSSNVAD
jgi:3-hydroxyacyl-CoA dehydrogenase/enoyl-CoA hydratase/3-hydroxybutyryl-CoA epimerase